MPDSSRFVLVFQKLQEAIAEDASRDPLATGVQSIERLTVEELDEISELRRLAQSFSESEPTTYTTT